MADSVRQVPAPAPRWLLDLTAPAALVWSSFAGTTEALGALAGYLTDIGAVTSDEDEAPS